MNKRRIEFMRRSWNLKTESQESDNTRCYRHMMSERLRREKEKKGYLALHSMLPRGTRKDKNSIIQTATTSIQQLKRYKEVTERRNLELEVKLAAIGKEDAKSTKISFKVNNPTCGIDSTVEVLKCLKSLGSKTTSIQSSFSDQLSVVSDVETKASDDQVESAVQRILIEVERRKLLMHFLAD